MSLPPRIQKAPKRSSRWRSTAHCNYVRGFACCNCHETANVQVAHVRIGSNAGMGQKPDDWRTVPLCGPQEGRGGCHDLQHRMGERTFWDTYQKAHGQTVEDLIDVLCSTSPKAADIRRAKMERGDA